MAGNIYAAVSSSGAEWSCFYSISRTFGQLVRPQGGRTYYSRTMIIQFIYATQTRPHPRHSFTKHLITHHPTPDIIESQLNVVSGRNLCGTRK